MSIVHKSENKYLCDNKEQLKEFMKEEGFIFKNSTLQKDEYFMDIENELMSNNACIRIRILNNKEMILSYDGNIVNVGSIDIEDRQNVYSDISQYENIISFLADMGYYKYVSLNVLKEVYVKKDKEFYYTIIIDKVDNIGEFVNYDVYTDSDDKNRLDEVFLDFDKSIKKCLKENIKQKYRDYSSKCIYDNILKGDSLNRILIEIEKVIPELDVNNIETSIKNKYSILNLELIEKLEQLNIEVSIVYSNNNEELINLIKNVLNKIGYNPNFLNIKEIKEIAVRETLILEKQKKIDFSEVALAILNNRKH